MYSYNGSFLNPSQELVAQNKKNDELDPVSQYGLTHYESALLKRLRLRYGYERWFDKKQVKEITESEDVLTTSESSIERALKKYLKVGISQIHLKGSGTRPHRYIFVDVHNQEEQERIEYDSSYEPDACGLPADWPDCTGSIAETQSVLDRVRLAKQDIEANIVHLVERLEKQKASLEDCKATERFLAAMISGDEAPDNNHKDEL